MKRRLQVNRELLFIGLFMAVISSGQGIDDIQSNNVSGLKEAEFLKLPETDHIIQTIHNLKGEMNDNNITNINIFQGKPKQGKCEIVKKSDVKIEEVENKIRKQEKYKEQIFTTQYNKGMALSVETGYRVDANVTIANNYKSTQGQLNNLKESNTHENVSTISKSELIFRYLDNTLDSNKSTNLTIEQLIGLEHDKPKEKEDTTLYRNNSDSSNILQALNLSNETSILSNEASKMNPQSNYKSRIVKFFFPPTKNSRLDNKLYLRGSKYQIVQTPNIKSFENDLNVAQHIYAIKPLIHNRTILKYGNRSLTRILQLEPKIVYEDSVPLQNDPKPCKRRRPDKLRNMMNGVVVALVMTICILAFTFMILFCVKVHTNLSRRLVNFLHLPLPEFGPLPEECNQQQTPKDSTTKIANSTEV